MDPRKLITIVVAHGYNVESPDWNFVFEGDLETGRLGRGPKALYVALCEQADYMLWNTGNSRALWNGREFIEGEYSYRFACDHIDEWMHAFPHHFGGFARSIIEEFLQDDRRHIFEHVSRNTLGSALEAYPILDGLIGENPAHVISVSSRNHLRVAHHFPMILQQGHGRVGPLRSKVLRVSTEWADTGYADDGGMEFVQINERSGEDRYAPK